LEAVVRLAAVVIVLGTIAGCAEDERHARVIVELDEDVDGSISSLQIAVRVTGADGTPLREEEATLPKEHGGRSLKFPADFVVLLGDASGALSVAVTGVGPEEVALASGAEEIEVASGGAGRVATMHVVLGATAGSLGCGDGTVATGELCYGPAIAPTTLSAWGVRAADLDGDGLADIVAAVGGEDPGRGLSLTRARGGDEFEPPVTHFGPAVPGAGLADVAVGDVDGDGLPDAILSSAARAAPLVTLGREEDPRFGVVTAIRDPGPDPAGLSPILADLDADGDLDLCTRSDEHVWAGLNDGDGTFTTLATAAVPALTGFAAGNLDDDVPLEIVAVSANGDVLHVLDDGLEPVTTHIVDGLRNVAIIDVDGAPPDEIVAGVAATVQVMHLEGGEVVADGEVDVQPGRAVALAPLHLDGERQGVALLVDEQRVDVGYLPQVVTLVPADGRSLEVRSRARVYCWNGTMTTADLEGDGNDEALVSCEGGGVAIVRAESAGGELVVQPMRGVFTWNFTVGDIDGDAQPDVLLVPWALELVRRADEPNAGDFPEALDGSPGGNLDPVFADFTGDARDDLASICDELSWCEEGALKRWTASPGGAIETLPALPLPAEPEVLTVARTVPGERVRLVVGMLDGGLVVVNGETGETEATASGVPAPAFALAAGPLDQTPGDDAVAIGEADDGSMVVFRGDGAGGFADGELHGATQRPSALVVADLDGDGRAEIVVGQEGSPHVQVLWLADGGVEDAGSFETMQAPERGSAADLDGDGLPELLLASYGRIEMWNLVEGAAVLRKTLVGFGGYASAPCAWPRVRDPEDPVAPVLFAAGQPDLGDEGWMSYVMTWLPRP
jgi:hypothetical protein